MKKISLLGVPFDKGSPFPGAGQTPALCRKENIVNVIRDTCNHAYDVVDYGDMTFDDANPDEPSCCGIKRAKSIGQDMKKLSDKVYDVTKDSDVTLLIGGDRSMSLGSISGHARAHPETSVVWVDAHADMKPPQTTSCEDIYAMPLAFLVEEVQQFMPRVPGFEWLKPCIPAKNLAFIGIRSLTETERWLIRELNICCYDAFDVQRLGIHHVIQAAVDAINPTRDRNIHLSVDVDSLDPMYCPSTGVKEAGGLTLREAMYVAHHLGKTGLLSAVEVAEAIPTLGSPDDVTTTVQSVMEVIKSAVGGRSAHAPIADDFKIRLPESDKP